MPYRRSQHGATFIDAVVGTALMLLVFIGLFGVIKLALVSVGLGKAKTGAIALANEQVEYLRSLPYNNVAVVGGIPAGTIPSSQSIILNNIAYIRRTFVEFVDSPVDGVGPADTNGIQADYKLAKVDVAWRFQNATRTTTLLTNIVPKGVETLDGGGTLAINVVNAAGAPVTNADIAITNNSVNPHISIGTFSNSAGTAYFPGAPASTAYHIVTTKAGYSTEQTYVATTSNPNPNPRDLTVVNDTITSSTFRIDLLSNLIVRSFDEVRNATWTDSFVDVSKIVSSNNITVGSGAAALTFGGTSYFSPGTLTATTVAPTYLAAWKRAEFDKTNPASTTVAVQLYYDTGAGYALVPDTALAGNSAGFSTSPINISALATSTYPRLRLRGSLGSTGGLSTPSLLEWRLIYDEGPVPRPNVGFSIAGTKTMGTDGSGNPIYKYQNTFTTGSMGTSSLSNIEWDMYRVSKGAGETTVSIAQACPFQPFGLNPGVTQILDFIFAPASTNSLLVYVTDNASVPLSGATVRATRSGYDVTQTTSSCGQTFFRNLTAGTYTLTISKTGYTSQTINNVSGSGAATRTVLLNP